MLAFTQQQVCTGLQCTWLDREKQDVMCSCCLLSALHAFRLHMYNCDAPGQIARSKVFHASAGAVCIHCIQTAHVHLQLLSALHACTLHMLEQLIDVLIARRMLRSGCKTWVTSEQSGSDNCLSRCQFLPASWLLFMLASYQASHCTNNPSRHWQRWLCILHC